jgi:hypothetical protein
MRNQRLILTKTNPPPQRRTGYVPTMQIRGTWISTVAREERAR